MTLTANARLAPGAAGSNHSTECEPANNTDATPKLGVHPAADIFPLMAADELQDLADDIKTTGGLLHAITLDSEGRILEGRNRYAACELAGVEPRFETYKGDNPVGFVISANLKRRHLDESQRAFIASKLATLSHGGDRRSNQGANLHLEIPKASVAAAMLNVSERLLKSAAVVRKHGTPELIRKVEAGEISVSAAAKQAQPPKAKPKSKPATEAEPKPAKPETPSKAAEAKCIDFGSLAKAWHDVELAAEAGNKTNLKASLENLLRKVDCYIKAGAFK